MVRISLVPVLIPLYLYVSIFRSLLLLLLLFNYALQPLRPIVRSGIDVPTFATRRLHACHHERAPSGGRWNCGRKISGNFAQKSDFHLTFRDLLHAVKLRHGTDGFTSPPKKGVLKIRRLRPGANPRTWVPKASTLPLDHRSRTFHVTNITVLPWIQYLAACCLG
jgi:hypothetical protein